MLKEIREHYGIPQSVFADYLGVTRSNLSMAESGRRNLSSEITLDLLPFFLVISQPKSKRTDEALGKELILQKEDLYKLIDWRKKEIQYKLPLLEKLLSRMKEDQARSALIIESIESLRAECKPKDMVLLSRIELNARKLQRKTGENVQLKLELQIQQLQSEISYLKKRSK